MTREHELEDALKKLEWSSGDSCGRGEYCPVCLEDARGEPDYEHGSGKHLPDCWLNKLLKEKPPKPPHTSTYFSVQKDNL